MVDGRSGIRTRLARLIATVAGAGVLALAGGGADAGAATQIGQTFTPPSGCDFPLTQIQTTSPGSIYAAPTDGVITSWSFMAAVAEQPRLKLKVARAVGGNDFLIVGDSPAEAPAAGVLNTFPTRISVHAGDVIGFHNVTQGICGMLAPMGYASHNTPMNVEAQAGTTTTFSPGSFRLDISALLEPDADRDGFGDETQDACPANPEFQAEPCDRSAPDTRINSGPKDRTKKKTATFAFSGTDARALAGFECSLDGAAFASCTSPLTVRVRKGRHTFSVRATDQAGNADASPATDAWKVKRKKKKK